jgi:hypothetical protein
MQPGDTITPQNKSDDDAVEITIPRDSPSASTDTSPAPPPAAPLPETPSARSEPVTAEPSPWQYSSEVEPLLHQPAKTDLSPVTWTASEFVDHEKNSSWFMTLAAITAAAVVIIYFITHDLITSFVIIIAAALFGTTARRKPRTLQYQLDDTGVTIGGKLYAYAAFKSFTLLEEGAFNSIELMPLQRFMPPISLYYPPENEEQIVNLLGNYLAHEERTRDAVDRLMRKVRF